MYFGHSSYIFDELTSNGSCLMITTSRAKVLIILVQLCLSQINIDMRCHNHLFIVVNFFTVERGKVMVTSKVKASVNSPETLKYKILEPHEKSKLISNSRLHSRIRSANIKPCDEHDGKTNKRKNPIHENHYENFDTSLLGK